MKNCGKLEKGTCKLGAAESIEATIIQTIDEVDLQVADLTRYLEVVGTKDENKKWENKLKFEQKSKMELLDQPTMKPPSKRNVKMPKLVITNYDGTWLSLNLI